MSACKHPGHRQRTAPENPHKPASDVVQPSTVQDTELTVNQFLSNSGKTRSRVEWQPDQPAFEWVGGFTLAYQHCNNRPAPP